MPVVSGDLTRQCILDAAEEAFLAEGYATVSVAAIADQAHTAVGSIYHHFGDKAGLQLAVNLRIHEMMLFEYLTPPLDAPGTALERLVGTTRAFVRFTEEHPERAVLLGTVSYERIEGEQSLHTWRRQTEQVTAHLARLTELVVQAQEDGEIRSGDPGRMVLSVWVGLYGLCALFHRYPAAVRASAGMGDLADVAEYVIIGSMMTTEPVGPAT